MRNCPELDSMQGIVRTDCDHIIHRYKFETRDVQAIMIVEVKTHEKELPETQRDTLHMINQLMRNRRSNIHKDVKFQAGNGALKVKSAMTMQDVMIRNFGVHTIRFSHSNPLDSVRIWWNKRLVNVAQLIKLLRFDLDPDTLRPMDMRIHQRKLPETPSLFR
jgi:hypothetical protein